MTQDLEALLREAQVRRVPVLLAFMQKGLSLLREGAASSRVFARKRRMGRQSADAGNRYRQHDADARLRGAAHDASRVCTRARHTHGADDHGVRDRGRRTGEPVVGLLTEDFYSAYIVQALEAGYTQVTAAPR